MPIIPALIGVGLVVFIWNFGMPEWQLRIGFSGSCSGSRAPLANIACAFAANLIYSIDVSAWRYILFVYYEEYSANRSHLDIVTNPRAGAVVLFSKHNG